MEKVLDYKCLNCHASVKFNNKLNKFICDYCKSEFTKEDFNKHKKKLDVEVNLHKEFNETLDMSGYHCNNCGAEILSLENISSTSCLYCKSSAIIKNRLSGIYKPDSIIKFKYKKEDAINAFLKITKGRPLLPKGFNKKENIKDLEGLYVPFWLYNVLNDATLKADCTKVSTWMDSRYVYTKTSYYKVERSGKLSFKSIPNDAASRFDDQIMNAIEPFNYQELEDFDPGYLAGFLSEKFDVSKDKAYLNAKTRIENDSISYLQSEMYGYNTVIKKDEINNLSLQETKYVLLPVFVLNIKYQDKIYHFAMNGQTGKLVGEIPIDKKKLVIYILITFITCLIIILGILLLIGYRW